MRRAGVTLTTLLLVGLSTSGRADPLDEVTGTEGWTAAKRASIADEWEDWFRGRVAWRHYRLEFQRQRRINRRLAQLLRRRAPPSVREVRRILQSARGAAHGGVDPGTAWSEVPVERLDDTGQGIDLEGARELGRPQPRREP
jgi:hypothetical protein